MKKRPTPGSLLNYEAAPCFVNRVYHMKIVSVVREHMLIVPDRQEPDVKARIRLRPRPIKHLPDYAEGTEIAKAKLLDELKHCCERLG